jgi:hypothetical protein
MLGQMVLYRLARGPRDVQQEIDRGVGVDWRWHRFSFARPVAGELEYLQPIASRPQ